MVYAFCTPLLRANLRCFARSGFSTHFIRLRAEAQWLRCETISIHFLELKAMFLWNVRKEGDGHEKITFFFI